MLALNERGDRAEIALRLATGQHVQIPDFVAPAKAEGLAVALEKAKSWCHVLSAGDKVYEIGPGELDRMPSEQKETLERLVNQSAQSGFQFRYDTIRVEQGGDVPPLLEEFATVMNEPSTIDYLREITGEPAIDFADCQATRYRPGDFLTHHDDEIEGKNRHFAYVLSLSRAWRAEYGGLLQFLDAQGAVESTLMPRFGALNLFRVGPKHLVGQVASYAPHPRLSVTGWLRSRA